MDKQAFVISDLHIGGGPADPQLEDFEQNDAFVKFVDAIAHQDTTLIINGDFIDFIQIPPYTTPKPAYLLWTAQASRQKLKSAATAHSKCFEALKRFIAAGARLRIMIGNHDLDLAWPEVQNDFRTLIAAAPGQAVFTIGHDLYEGVWIEHGHEFTSENCPVDPANFFHDWSGARYLERVWGTDFVLRFYNDLERKHPYADSIKPTITALYYGLKKRWVGGAELCRLALFLKARGIPWRAVASAMLEEDAATVSTATVMADMDDREWQDLIAERAADPEFETQFNAEAHALSGEEKRVLSQTKAIPVADADAGSLTRESEAATLGMFRADREVRAALDRLGRSGVTHVVFGHTHEVVNGGTGDVKGRLFNTGTWIPRLNLGSPEIRLKIKRQGGLTLEMLDDARLYVCDRLAVHIIPDEKNQSRVNLVEVPSFDVWRD